MGLHRSRRNVAGYPTCSVRRRVTRHTQSAPRPTVRDKKKQDLMMRRLLIVVVTVVMVGCGGGSTPTASPSPVPAPVPAAPPIPTASIVSAGGGSWSKCNNSGCVFNGPMRNSGVGCANAVRGTVTFNNGQNQPLGTYQWSISAMVRPDEAFVFTTALGAIPPNVSAAQGNYLVSPSWTDVRCP
jgi:hypothetical protein